MRDAELLVKVEKLAAELAGENADPVELAKAKIAIYRANPGLLRAVLKAERGGRPVTSD